MILKLYRCLKPESNHFFEIGNLIDTESDYYHFLKFSDGAEENLTREEVQAINVIDTETKQSYDEVTQEQLEYLEEIK